MGKEVDTNNQSSGSQSDGGGQSGGDQGGHQAQEPAGPDPLRRTVAQSSSEKPGRKRNLVQAKIAQVTSGTHSRGNYLFNFTAKLVTARINSL